MRWITLIIWVLPAFAGSLEVARRDAAHLFAEWKIEDAERVLRQAVEVERHTGGVDPNFTIALNELGTLNQDLGRHREAERFYKESIALGDRPGLDWSIGYPLTNLAGLMLAYGRPKDALDLATRAVRSHAQVFERESSAVGMAQNARAQALAKLGRLEEAEVAAGIATAILQKHSSSEDLGTCYYVQAEIAWLREDAAKAEEFLTKANAIWAESLSYGHTSAISSLASLGSLKARTNPEESERLLKQALDLAETKLGKQHHITGSILLRFAEKLEFEGRKREAKAIRRRGEAILSAYAKENLLQHSIDVNSFRVKTLK